MICSALIVFAAFSFGIDGPPQIDRKKIAQVKSVFLLNFLKFTEWPKGPLKNEESPYVVGILGKDDLGPVLESIMKKGTVRNHPIRLVRSDLPDLRTVKRKNDENAVELDRLREFVTKCHVVYIPKSSTKLVNSFFMDNEFMNTLIVGDDKSLLEGGGQLAFALEEDHIVFFASLENLKQRDFKVSSRLLQLARADQ